MIAQELHDFSKTFLFIFPSVIYHSLAVKEKRWTTSSVSWLMDLDLDTISNMLIVVYTTHINTLCIFIVDCTNVHHVVQNIRTCHIRLLLLTASIANRSASFEDLITL